MDLPRLEGRGLKRLARVGLVAAALLASCGSQESDLQIGTPLPASPTTSQLIIRETPTPAPIPNEYQDTCEFKSYESLANIDQKRGWQFQPASKASETVEELIQLGLVKTELVKSGTYIPSSDDVNTVVAVANYETVSRQGSLSFQVIPSEGITVGPDGSILDTSEAVREGQIPSFTIIDAVVVATGCSESDANYMVGIYNSSPEQVENAKRAFAIFFPGPLFVTPIPQEER